MSRTKSSEWEKDQKRKQRIKAKKERIEGLVAVLKMHEAIRMDKRDLSYIAQVRYRINRAKAELRQMTGSSR